MNFEPQQLVTNLTTRTDASRTSTKTWSCGKGITFGFGGP